jgi:hypothetical protein
VTTIVLADPLVVTVGAGTVGAVAAVLVAAAAVLVAAAVVVAAVAGPQPATVTGGPTAVTVVVPPGPTVVIAFPVAAGAGQAAGGDAAVRLTSPADAAPASPSASKAIAATTRRATRPP